MKSMAIRDSFATINGDVQTYTMPSGGIEIVADDGRPLFHVHLKDGVLEVSGGGFCKHEEKVLSESICIHPRASNLVYISRDIFGA